LEFSCSKFASHLKWGIPMEKPLTHMASDIFAISFLNIANLKIDL
jgi:hypothetical protein